MEEKEEEKKKKKKISNSMGRILNAKIQNSNKEHINIKYASIEDVSRNKREDNAGPHTSKIRAGLLGAAFRVMSYGYFILFRLIKLLYYVLKTCHIIFVQLYYWNCMGDGGPLAS